MAQRGHVEELQGLVDTLSRQLRVTMTPIGEDPAERAVSGADLGADCGLVTSAEIVLRNEGPAISSRPSGWAIYFSSIRRVLSVDHAGFQVERLVGDLHRMEPTADFAGFGAGEEIVVPIVVEYWMLLATDVFPRWYIAGGAGVDLIPQVIASTDTEDPSVMISDWPVESLRRGVDDRMVRSTPAGRLARYRSAPHPPPAATANRPVPNVRDQTVTAGAFLDLTDGIRLCGDLPRADQLEVLAAAVEARGIPEGPIRIDLRVDPDGVEEVDRAPGGYRLKVATDGITIDGVDRAGVLNGMRCLLSLVPAPGRAPRLPVTTIHDAPRYGYRGLCLDAARHVISPPVIVSIVEQMAALRMNVLHLRLSDDEGWRLEIPGLPELTEVGGRRRHGNDEHDGLLPQLGSGPDDSTTGSGWYTRDDYVAMVRAAAARGVTIIPEFDMPAHARAAVVAMEARSRRLVDQGASSEDVAQHRLTDPRDTTRLTTIQYYDNLSTLNPFVPGALTFVDEVIGAVASMHEEAGQPLSCWHYGGDEASNVLLGPGFSDTSDPIEGTGIIDKAAQDEPWSGSPAVRQAVADGVVESPAEVPTWFAQRVAEVAQRHGVTTLQAWQDGFKHADGADDFSIAARVNLWETSFWGAPQSLPHQLSLGYEVVVTTPDYLYLDTPPELHELERGYYWAGRELDEQRIFSFAVENPAQNAELYPDRDGAPFAAESRALPAAPIGLSAAVFGELMRTEDQLYAALFPRLLAVAERAWYQPSWELPAVDGVTFRTGTTDFTDAVAVAVDFAGFTAAVGARMLPWLERHGIPFRVPPPAARVSDGVLTMAAPYSGLTCQWCAASTGGDADQWQDWSEDVRVGGTVQVRTRSDASGRTSRVESVADDGASADLDQKVVDAVAEGMQLEVTLLDNQAEHVVDAAALGAGWATVFTLEVTLRNESKATLPSRGWALHVPSIRRLLDVMGADIRLRHITGDHHVLEPGPGLPALAPGESMTFVLVGENFVLHRREILPRWYISAPGLEPRVLAATDDENLGFVAPFAAANFLAREDDTTERVTGEVRYRRNADLDRVDRDDVAARVVPNPITTVRGEGWCDLAAGLDLTACPTEVTEATRSWWQSRAAVLGLELSLGGGGGGTPLRVVIDASSLPDEIRAAGGYRLDVASTRIDVTAADAAAAGHAMMTLFGLLPAPGRAVRVPVCRIDDAPRYQHRALMLDIARNFRSAEYLRRLIDQLAAYKLNIFHLHLTDDEGWRLEIPGLPELTDVGSRRGHTSDERDMLWAQLGSGPTPRPGGEYLAGHEYVELLRYAAARGVEILPEFDLPGHCRAAVMAMESRYHRLRAEGQSEEVAAQFRLMDPEDDSHILTVQAYGIHSTLNPAVPGTEAFVEHIVGAVARLHEEAGVPLRRWHFGGDEVVNILLGAGYTDVADPEPDRGVCDRSAQHHPWQRSPVARERIQRDGLPDVGFLPVVLMENVQRILRRNGVEQAFAWHDSLDHADDADEFLLPTIAETWGPLSDGGVEALCDLQRRGFATVMSAPDFLYFDAPQEADPEEQGATWATRSLDVRQVFSLTPDNPPQVADGGIARLGASFRSVGSAPLEPMYGLQAALWTETTRTDEQADYMLFPRLLAFAERAWSRSRWEQDYEAGRAYGPGETGQVDHAGRLRDYSEFITVVGSRELAKLDAAGVAYWIPAPGYTHDGSRLRINAAVPGLRVAVSDDDGATWKQFDQNSPVEVKEQLVIATLSADRKRRSRIIYYPSMPVD